MAITGEDPMYMRFTTIIEDRCSGLHLGVINAAYRNLRYNPDLVTWLRREIRTELDWFDDHLDAPGKFAVRPYHRHKGRYGVCWFNSAAKLHIAHARYLAWLVTEAGRPVREIKTKQPGAIVWRDRHQIVAVANKEGPIVRE